ncbi:DUF6491 family protein [Pseudohongiella acticola]|jgi:uncharacterized protein DUF6491|uniref:DUF6491 family protein n=1 Tax=Pseudohongiella acticola TaxID=1524254 RepID=UPI0030EF365C
MLNHRTLLYRLVTAAALPMALTACASPGPSTQDAIMAGMLGEEENSVCFTRNIRSWHDFDDRSIVIETLRDEYYKLELAGGCNTRNSFMQIAVESRGGSCLGPGDRISFDRDQGLSCAITQINRWHLADEEELSF